MFQNSRYSVVVNIALFVLGIYFVAAPNTALPTIVTVLSIASFAYGVWELLMYYRATKNGTDSNRPLMLAIAAVLVGVLLLVFRTQLILGALPIVFALWMVFIAFQRITQAMTLKETGVIVSYICPLMYMNNPLSGKIPVITSSNKLRTYTTARYHTDDEILARITKGGKHA